MPAKKTTAKRAAPKKTTRKRRGPAEPRGPEGKPRTGRQDAGGNGAGLDEFSQARLDENPVLGLYRARI